MANHAFLEVFTPERGRVARTGSPLFTHMVVAERFNKHLRSLLKQYKTPAKHLMITRLRENMIEVERIINLMVILFRIRRRVPTSVQYTLVRLMKWLDQIIFASSVSSECWVS